MRPDPVRPGEKPAPIALPCAIVLKPISHPALDDIRIEENLFAIGRTEPPFLSYESALVADLSRRHARLFSEFGAVYIADLGSKNGTTVNGVPVRQKPARLQEGDEICLGRTLSFRVQLGAPLAAATRPERLLSLTLTPEQGKLPLQPLVIALFPFLISKADAAFVRYKEKFPHQINYISRRHAHIFLKNGHPFIEDLGSTNGTFVAGKRLDEHAVALQAGDLVAFGGHQLVYRVSLQTEAVSDPTATRLSLVTPPGAPAGGEIDKTTFLASADSFLDIFCVDQSPQEEDEINKEIAAAGDKAPSENGLRGQRHKLAIFLSELKEAFAGQEAGRRKRIYAWGGGLAAGLAVLLLGIYLAGAPERNLKDLLASGEYAQAAMAARQLLERHPDSLEFRALATEALLKAKLPGWLAMLKAHDFAGAAATTAGMRELATGNPDVQPLLGELEWIGQLEEFVAARPTGEAPIQIYVDEEKIAALLKAWDEDARKYQQAATAIAAHVPEFREVYAEALSHLRRLQSDDSVYLAAIERLKTAISTALSRDRPESLDAIFNEYAEKYPRLGGMDRLRDDLRQYIALDNEAHARKLGPLLARLAKHEFTTPPFQEKLRALGSSGRLPSAEVVSRYQSVAAAWQGGNSQQAIEALQKMTSGPWADAASAETEHKKAVAEAFAGLQKAHGSADYDERLLAIYGLLVPGEDEYFLQAIAADFALIREQALKRAQEMFKRAEGHWQQYRDNGPIEGAQRLETSISSRFRTQARRLAGAQAEVQQGERIYRQLKVDFPETGREIQEDIKAEVALQRNSLLELRGVLPPAVLEAKLGLLGGQWDDER